MSKVSTIIAKTLSFRLSLRIIAALALLLMLALLLVNPARSYYHG